MVTNGSLFGFADTADNLVAAHSMAVGLTFYKNGKELPVREMPGSVTVRIAMVSCFLFKYFSRTGK